MSTPISQLGIQPHPNTNNLLNMSGPMAQPTMNGSMDAAQRNSPVDTPSYADLLKNMQNDVTRDKEHQQNAEHQQLQMQNQMYQDQMQQMQMQQQMQHQMQQQMQQQKIPDEYNDDRMDEVEYAKKEVTKADTSIDFQTEIVILLLIHCFVHLEVCQTIMKSKIPSAFSSMTNSPTVVGVMINGVSVVFIWIVLRKFMTHYMKQ